ncbi:hypothetical protein OHS59_43990 [Streptomyces sp. NBC_00414]|uniref:hypothetical protein n=1 Tax=Streptomyces sp. NBC_00414 TaxID=2975739 RepID=UPI002E1D4616
MLNSTRKRQAAATILLAVAAVFPATDASAAAHRSSMPEHSVRDTELTSTVSAAEWIRWTAFFNRETCEANGKYMVDNGFAAAYQCVYEGWPVWALWVYR